MAACCLSSAVMHVQHVVRLHGVRCTLSGCMVSVAWRPLHVFRLHVGCCTLLRSAAAWRRYPLHPSHTRLRDAVEEADDARAAARHAELLVRRVDDRRAPAPCVCVCVCVCACTPRLHRLGGYVSTRAPS